MNAKISVFVVFVAAIIYLLLYNLHDCTSNNCNDGLALLINTAKQNYYSKIVEKFYNTQRSSNAYWAFLKIFLNSKKYL